MRLCLCCFSFCSEANQNVERDDPEPARPAAGRGGRLHRLHPRHSVHRQVRAFSLVHFQYTVKKGSRVSRLQPGCH